MDISLNAFRKYQRLEFKLQKAKLDLTFLEDCKKNKVIPKFLNFKLANRDLQNSNAYLQCQRKLLNEEISIVKHSRIAVLSLEVTEVISKLTALVSTIDAIHLRSVCDRENSAKLRHHERIQQKKLFRLCGDASKSSIPNHDKVIFNYSSRTFTDAEKTLLARGLNFSLPPHRPRFCDFLAPFEKLYGILKKEPISKNPINGFNEELIKTRKNDIALMGYKTYIPPKSIFSDDEFKIIEGLQKDNNIYLIKPDKGNGVVIINRTDYNSRMLNILDDNTKFERINLKKSNIYKETTRREDAVRTLINELKSIMI